MSGAIDRHCIPGLICPQPDGELLCGCPGIIKTMHTGFSAYVLHYANAPGADTEETGRYDLAWKDLCSVLNALSK